MRYPRYQSFGLNPIVVIISVNLALLIAAMVNPRLIYILGLTPAIFSNQPWTIVTSMFVHAGFWHLFTNMLTLYFFGTFFSRLVGWRWFLVVYFVGGIIGNIFYLFLGMPFAPAVGASGAIFSLAGALVMMTPRLSVFIFPIPVPMPLWVAVIGGFILLSFMPYVAWQAHLGGLIAGLIAGYFLKRRERRLYMPRY